MLSMRKPLLTKLTTYILVLYLVVACSSDGSVGSGIVCPELVLASGQDSRVVGSEHRDGRKGYSWSPDCAYVTWLVDHGGGNIELWIADTAEFNERQLTSELATASVGYDFDVLLGSEYYARWSPTREHLMIAVGDYIEEASLLVVDPSNGSSWIAAGDAEFVSWSPDGEWILYGNNRREREVDSRPWGDNYIALWIVASRPDTQPHLIHDEVNTSGVHWSADSSAILHLIPGTGPDTYDLLAIDIDSMESETITRGLTGANHRWSPDGSMIMVVKEQVTYIYDRETALHGS